MKYLSLFSGIGGFELGIQNSKHKLECIGFSEVDKYATSIYKKRFPKHKQLGDVNGINTKELPDFNLLVGGFPCQAFSIAGKRRGFDDTRGTLFFEIARILKDKKPKYFLLENVKGLLSHDKGRTFKTILEVLSNLGYNVQWEVLNSKNYGVPQNRERIYIKGYFGGECGGEVLSVPRKSKETNGKINSYRDKSRNCSIYPNNETLSRTLTSTGQNCGKNHIIKVGKKLNNKAQAQTIYDIDGLSCTLSANGGGDGGKTGLYDVTSYDEVEKNNFIIGRVYGGLQEHCAKTDGSYSPTLTEAMGKGGCHVPLLKLKNKDYRVRRLTPVECERLQGFPDNWTKYGEDDELISDTQRYKCIGNAVTTNVILYIMNNWDMEL